MGKYDNAYKYLFSNKRIFFQLVTSFVKEDFVAEIILDNIELLDKSFVSDEFLARESDIIYRIKLKTSEVYIYFLLEFQSTIDKSIPIRMLLYLLQFYDLLLRNSREGLLPSVFPLLLYNGQKNWSIPSNVRDLIDKRIPDRFIPSFEYYKIIEKGKDKNALKKAIDKVIEMIRQENIIDIRMFTIWFKRMFQQKVDFEETEKITNLMEVTNMLTAIADQIKLEGKLEGKLEDAKKMKEEGFDITIIMKITGLSKEEIEKL
jgi:predicted transposase YdaD